MQLHCGSFASKTVTVDSPIPIASFPFDSNSIPVTVYVVVTEGETVIEEVVSLLGLQIKLVAPEALRTASSPGQGNISASGTVVGSNLSGTNTGDQDLSNLVTNSSEFYNFSYDYKNDCLIAGVLFRREFYTDRDIEPENSIMFTISLIPFANLNSPTFKSAGKSSKK